MSYVNIKDCRPGTVRIVKVRDDFYTVETKTIDGDTHAQLCTNEVEAICYAKGVVDVYQLARYTLQTSLRFDGSLVVFKP